MHLLLLLLYYRYLLSSVNEGMHYLFRLTSGIVRYPWNLPIIWRTFDLMRVVYIPASLSCINRPFDSLQSSKYSFTCVLQYRLDDVPWFSFTCGVCWKTACYASVLSWLAFYCLSYTAFLAYTCVIGLFCAYK
jgi:hypothetical protein